MKSVHTGVYVQPDIMAHTVKVTINQGNLSLLYELRVRIMLFNATFNNISVIPWQSVLLVEETGVPREDH